MDSAKRAIEWLEKEDGVGMVAQSTQEDEASGSERLPERMVDYFLVVGVPHGAEEEMDEDGVEQKRSEEGGVEVGATVLARYPPVDWSDVPFPDSAPLFCCPRGVEVFPWGESGSVSSLESEGHSFVMTDVTGAKSYGHCLTIQAPAWVRGKDGELRTVRAPLVLCVTTGWPLLTPFHALLRSIASAAVSGVGSGEVPLAPALLAAFATRARYPLPGRWLRLSASVGAPRLLPGPGSVATRISRPLFHALPPSDAEGLRVLLGCLGARGAIRLWSVLLLEQRVLLHSQETSRLACAAQGLTSLLFPMVWSHVYVPLLPLQLLEYLQAPVPALMGVHSDALALREGAESVQRSWLIHLDLPPDAWERAVVQPIEVELAGLEETAEATERRNSGLGSWFRGFASRDSQDTRTMQPLRGDPEAAAAALASVPDLPSEIVRPLEAQLLAHLPDGLLDPRHRRRQKPSDDDEEEDDATTWPDREQPQKRALSGTSPSPSSSASADTSPEWAIRVRCAFADSLAALLHGFRDYLCIAAAPCDENGRLEGPMPTLPKLRARSFSSSASNTHQQPSTQSPRKPSSSSNTTSPPASPKIPAVQRKTSGFDHAAAFFSSIRKKKPAQDELSLPSLDSDDEDKKEKKKKKEEEDKEKEKEKEVAKEVTGVGSWMEENARASFGSDGDLSLSGVGGDSAGGDSTSGGARPGLMRSVSARFSSSQSTPKRERRRTAIEQQGGGGGGGGSPGLAGIWRSLTGSPEGQDLAKNMDESDMFGGERVTELTTNAVRTDGTSVFLRVAFHRRAFLQSRPRNWRPFLSVFTCTQAFTAFLEDAVLAGRWEEAVSENFSGVAADVPGPPSAPASEGRVLDADACDEARHAILGEQMDHDPVQLSAAGEVRLFDWLIRRHEARHAPVAGAVMVADGASALFELLTGGSARGTLQDTEGDTQDYSLDANALITALASPSKQQVEELEDAGGEDGAAAVMRQMASALDPTWMSRLWWLQSEARGLGGLEDEEVVVEDEEKGALEKEDGVVEMKSRQPARSLEAPLSGHSLSMRERSRSVHSAERDQIIVRARSATASSGEGGVPIRRGSGLDLPGRGAPPANVSARRRRATLMASAAATATAAVTMLRQERSRHTAPVVQEEEDEEEDESDEEEVEETPRESDVVENTGIEEGLDDEAADKEEAPRESDVLENTGVQERGEEDDEPRESDVMENTGIDEARAEEDGAEDAGVDVVENTGLDESYGPNVESVSSESVEGRKRRFSRGMLTSFAGKVARRVSSVSPLHGADRALLFSLQAAFRKKGVLEDMNEDDDGESSGTPDSVSDDERSSASQARSQPSAVRSAAAASGATNEDEADVYWDHAAESASRVWARDALRTLRENCASPKLSTMDTSSPKKHLPHEKSPEKPPSPSSSSSSSSTSSSDDEDERPRAVTYAFGTRRYSNVSVLSRSSLVRLYKYQNESPPENSVPATLTEQAQEQDGDDSSPQQQNQPPAEETDKEEDTPITTSPAPKTPEEEEETLLVKDAATGKMVPASELLSEVWTKKEPKQPKSQPKTSRLASLSQAARNSWSKLVRKPSSNSINRSLSPPPLDSDESDTEQPQKKTMDDFLEETPKEE